MRRSFLAFAILLAACQPSDSGTSPTSPTTGSVSRLVLTVPSNAFVVGESVRGTATPYDASGNAVSNRTITWASSTPTVATVSTSGTVTGLAVGTTNISATVDGSISAALTVSVLAAPAACSTTNAVTMTVGEIRTVTGSSRSQLCVAGGTAGADYALSVVNLDTGATMRTLSMLPAGTQAVGTPLAPSFANLVAAGAGDDDPAERVHLARQRAMRRVLGPRMAAERQARAARSSGSNIKGITGVPTVGTIVRLNTNGDGVNGNPCIANASDYHGARVAAVTTRAIVIVDTTAPSGGLTDAEYQQIATTFDTLVYDSDVSAFGAPFDADANGRVVLFFTPGVNSLTPANANYVIGGFFDSRDLYASTGTNPCTGSNEGEMFYLPVLDPARRYNGVFTSRPGLVTGVINTLAHEFQHLINWSRRLNVTNASAPEDLFLDEGLSHLAEELLYYKASGLTALSNINFTTITATSTIQSNYLNYQDQNMQRLLSFMANPNPNSAWANNDSLATRGATWGMLRFMIDAAGGASSSYTLALVNSNRQGLDNLNFVFGGTFTTPYQAAQAFAMSLLTDGSTVPVSSIYAFKSWDLRSIMPRLANTPTVYPLSVPTLSPGVSRSASLAAGGMAFARFSVGSGGAGTIAFSSGTEALHTPITIQLVRTR